MVLFPGFQKLRCWSTWSSEPGLVISPSGACTGSKNKIKRCKASMHGAGTYMVRIPCMLLSCRNLLLINSAIWDPVRTQAGLLGLVGKYIGWFWLGAAQCTQSGIRAPCCTNAALFVCTAAAELPPAMSDVDVATVTQQLLVGCVPGGACLSQIQPPGTMLSTDTGILLCKIRACQGPDEQVLGQTAKFTCFKVDLTDVSIASRNMA